MNTYAHYQDALTDVAKPCAFIDADILQQNVHDIAAKSNKTIQIAKRCGF